MAIKKIDDKILSDIANAIRGKTASTDAIAVTDMPTQIEAIEAGGGGFDTSQMTSMANWFSRFEGTSIDFTGLDTSNVKNMYSMFYYSTSLKSLDFSSFDTSKVTSMASMFYSCTGLTELDLTSFDTSNVTNMNQMFSNCRGFSSLALPSFDTSNVTDMGYMFYACYSLTSLDLRNFSFSSVTSMPSMFGNCTKLETLHIGAETDTVPQPLLIANAFNNCPSTLKIYVPAHLVDAYKSATNWAQYADNIYAREV